MDTLTLLTQLSGVLALVMLLWLSIRAFKQHAVWGFLVLLLSPVGAFAYGVRHWASAKIPFLAYITTFTLSLFLALYLFSSWGGWELVKAYNRVQEGIQARNLSREDASAFIHTSLDFGEKSGLNPEAQEEFNTVRRHLEQLDKVEAAKARAAQAAAEAAARDELSRAMINKKTQSKKEQYTLVYRPIPVDEAKNYVGYTVKVTRRGGLEREYRLAGATGSKLQFAQRNTAGTYSFSYYTRDIEKIRVLTQQPD
ncbi:MAG TPA: hypothetical protein VET88_02725 [Gammaproteobacteria bacterium]|nr:hypothetical protein [Gammaproteobacteria bacterium]